MEAILKGNKKHLVIIGIGIVLLLFSGALPAFDKTDAAETQLTKILSHVEGVGKLEVMVSRSQDDEIKGVIIVAQGAENSAVKKQINDAAQTVFGLQTHKIQIYSYKNGKGR